MKQELSAGLRQLGLAAVCAASFGSAQAGGWERGELISGKTVVIVKKADIDAALAAQSAQLAALVGPAQCDVKLDGILFKARGPRGEKITSSGIVLTPVAGPGCKLDAAAPVVAYEHGTRIERSFLLSNPSNADTNAAIAWYAAKGYVVVAPDYHGLGVSNLPYHPYLNAEAEADASVDALRAARALLAKQGLTIGKLFVTGYSQGGHAAMATTRALETRYQGEFPLRAAAPMAGPYALEQTFVYGASNPTIGGTVIGAYAFIGYEKAYRNLYRDPREIFQTPYADTIERYFPGAETTDSIYAKGLIPLSLDALFTPAFLNDLRNRPDSAARRDLRRNALLDGWTPRVPLLLCHGARDPIVPYFNAPLAQQTFTARGATVGLIEADSAFGLPPFTSQQDVQNYHVQTVYPLCAIATRSRLFDPLK